MHFADYISRCGNWCLGQFNTVRYRLKWPICFTDNSLSVITCTHIQSITVILRHPETRVMEICVLLEDVHSRHLEMIVLWDMSFTQNGSWGPAFGLNLFFEKLRSVQSYGLNVYEICQVHVLVRVSAGDDGYSFYETQNLDQFIETILSLNSDRVTTWFRVKLVAHAFDARGSFHLLTITFDRQVTI